MRIEPFWVAGAILALTTGLTTAAPARAQQLGAELTVVNKLKKELKVVRITAYQVKDGQPAPVADSSVELAEDLEPGKEVKVTLQAGARARPCGTWIVNYQVRGGSGGGGMQDLCGKTRIVVGGSDPDFPEVEVE